MQSIVSGVWFLKVCQQFDALVNNPHDTTLRLSLSSSLKRLDLDPTFDTWLSETNVSDTSAAVDVYQYAGQILGKVIDVNTYTAKSHADPRLRLLAGMPE